MTHDGVGKTGVDRMTRDMARVMARELRPAGVVAMPLWPGVVETELLLLEPEQLPFHLSQSESPQLTGRVMAIEPR